MANMQFSGGYTFYVLIIFFIVCGVVSIVGMLFLTCWYQQRDEKVYIDDMARRAEAAEQIDMVTDTNRDIEAGRNNHAGNTQDDGAIVSRRGSEDRSVLHSVEDFLFHNELVEEAKLTEWRNRQQQQNSHPHGAQNSRQQRSRPTSAVHSLEHRILDETLPSGHHHPLPALSPAELRQQHDMHQHFPQRKPSMDENDMLPSIHSGKSSRSNSSSQKHVRRRSDLGNNNLNNNNIHAVDPSAAALASLLYNSNPTSPRIDRTESGSSKKKNKLNLNNSSDSNNQQQTNSKRKNNKNNNNHYNDLPFPSPSKPVVVEQPTTTITAYERRRHSIDGISALHHYRSSASQPPISGAIIRTTTTTNAHPHVLYPSRAQTPTQQQQSSEKLCPNEYTGATTSGNGSSHNNNNNYNGSNNNSSSSSSRGGVLHDRGMGTSGMMMYNHHHSNMDPMLQEYREQKLLDQETQNFARFVKHNPEMVAYTQQARHNQLEGEWQPQLSQPMTDSEKKKKRRARRRSFA